MAGYTSQIIVYARDAFGNLLEDGGDGGSITVLGRGPSKSSFIIGAVTQDYGNGTYLVRTWSTVTAH